MTDENWKLIARIADMANKLHNEAMRLRRDIMNLSARIEPFDGDKEVPEPFLTNFRHRNLREALDTLASASQGIRDCEFHLAAIRGRVDEIAAHAILRDELAPYIRSPSRHGNQGDPE